MKILSNKKMTQCLGNINVWDILLEVKKNQLKMVRRRGYNIDREAPLLKYKRQNFVNYFLPRCQKEGKTVRSMLTNVYEHTDPEKGRLVVYYAETPTTSQLGVNDAGKAIEYMREYGARTAIIITAKPLSTPAVKSINGLVGYNIQIFLEEEMSYDPTEHIFVPKHIPLTEPEQREFLTKNNISIDMMPVISTNDIIARYYGLRQGQVVRIERQNMYETMILNSVSYKVIKDVKEK